jgi:hypothetical protein
MNGTGIVREPGDIVLLVGACIVLAIAVPFLCWLIWGCFFGDSEWGGRK